MLVMAISKNRRNVVGNTTQSTGTQHRKNFSLGIKNHSPFRGFKIYLHLTNKIIKKKRKYNIKDNLFKVKRKKK